MIAVTGGNGQLGNELKVAIDQTQNPIIFTNSSELNITNKIQIQTFFEEKQPKILINCAAYTAVDKAEKEQEQANLINNIGVQNLIEFCNQHKCHLIHISTDYIFDGTNHTPYNENDVKNPQSIYGLTKSLGENEIIKNCNQYTIIRTSWVYSLLSENNFVGTIKRLSEKMSDVGIVSDQIGKPTNARDLAHFIRQIATNPDILIQANKNIYHFANSGAASWFDFSQAIKKRYNLKINIQSIATEEYPVLAKRPKYSVLNTKKAEILLNQQINWWFDAFMNA